MVWLVAGLDLAFLDPANGNRPGSDPNRFWIRDSPLPPLHTPQNPETNWIRSTDVKAKGGQVVRTRRTTCPGCPDRLSGMCNVLKWNTRVPKWNTESQKRPQNWSLAGGRMEDRPNQEKIRRRSGEVMYRGWPDPPSFPPLWGAGAEDRPMRGVDQVLRRKRERM